MIFKPSLSGKPVLDPIDSRTKTCNRRELQRLRKVIEMKSLIHIKNAVSSIGNNLNGKSILRPSYQGPIQWNVKFCTRTQTFKDSKESLSNITLKQLHGIEIFE